MHTWTYMCMCACVCVCARMHMWLLCFCFRSIPSNAQGSFLAKSELGDQVRCVWGIDRGHLCAGHMSSHLNSTVSLAPTWWFHMLRMYLLQGDYEYCAMRHRLWVLNIQKKSDKAASHLVMEKGSTVMIVLASAKVVQPSGQTAHGPGFESSPQLSPTDLCARPVVPGYHTSSCSHISFTTLFPTHFRYVSLPWLWVPRYWSLFLGLWEKKNILSRFWQAGPTTSMESDSAPKSQRKLTCSFYTFSSRPKFDTKTQSLLRETVPLVNKGRWRCLKRRVNPRHLVRRTHCFIHASHHAACRNTKPHFVEERGLIFQI